MKNITTIQDPAYIYSLWSGRLKVYEGFVFQGSHGQGYFSNLVTSKDRKRFGCSPMPGVVYNAVIWLPVRDEEQARQIFIAYEMAEITKLEDKISNHQHKIDILKQPS